MPPLDFSLLLNPAHWFDGNPGSASAWYWIPAVIFLALTVAGFYSYSYLRTGTIRHPRAARPHGRGRRHRSLSFGLWGLFLLLMRFLGVGLLSARIVLYLTLLAGAGHDRLCHLLGTARNPTRLAAYVARRSASDSSPPPRSARTGHGKAQKAPRPARKKPPGQEKARAGQPSPPQCRAPGSPSRGIRLSLGRDQGHGASASTLRPRPAPARPRPGQPPPRPPHPPGPRSTSPRHRSRWHCGYSSECRTGG